MHARPRADSPSGHHRHRFPDGGDRNADTHAHGNHHAHRHDANTDSRPDAHEGLDAESDGHSNTDARRAPGPGLIPDTDGRARRQGADNATPGYAHGRGA